jgi:hypothetical protein
MRRGREMSAMENTLCFVLLRDNWCVDRRLILGDKSTVPLFQWICRLGCRRAHLILPQKPTAVEEIHAPLTLFFSGHH